MVDALISMLPTAVAQWMFGAAPPMRNGNRHPISTPFGAYPTGDGYIVICVLSSAHFAALMACIGRPELQADPRFASDEQRTAHERELTALLTEWSRTLTVAAALERLHRAGVPASRIESPSEVFAGQHVRERALLSTVRHPLLGTIPAMEQPVHFSGFARGRQRPAPALDEHHRAVLERWLGSAGEQE